ncbi:MAG: glycosyltransferase family 39 protein [Anaerolineales bacterium]|nr:glycosyltransferase family 39 protein [Anaerolineales bacterium]
MTEKRAWLYDVLFVCVLLIAGFLRLTGVEWGEGYHQHPDELFLVGVLDNLRAHTCADEITPVDLCKPEDQRWMTIGEYFSTATSTLSPYNRGHAFFVYGNLPMTVTRIAMEMTGNDDIGKSKFFARQFSALADLFTIFILYLIVSNLYGRRVGLFAATFSTFAVMQIQQSHFFTTDLFVNLFMFLAIMFAMGIVEKRELGIGGGESDTLQSPTPDARFPNYLLRLIRSPLFLLSIGFGFALGMAMASKINAAALAILLPGAFIVRYFMYDKDKEMKADYWSLVMVFLIAGGLATIISFRIFQPYAFSGLGLNPQWVANIAEQRVQANGDADLPWNLQWARRTHLYSFTNLTVWGLGLPLGILAWVGFLLMGWRILQGEWKHLLLWGWTAFYFLWQSLQFNATMRYQLPVYPLLCMMAAWAIFEMVKLREEKERSKLFEIFVATIGVVVLVTTTIWAFAFQSIYTRDEPRMAASRWLFQNAEGPVNVKIKMADNTIYSQPLPVPMEMGIQAGAPFAITFTSNRDGEVSDIVIGHALDLESPSAIVLTLASASAPDVVLARASEKVDYTATNDPRGPAVEFELDNTVPLVKGQAYLLKIETLGHLLTLSGASIANETGYDWGLPFRIDAYDAFGGIYRGDLTLEVYWDDNADKVTRYVSMLSMADYIVIPTNHQYAQITRLPERYPLTTYYYRELLGCPDGKDIIECYRTAQPGQYEGNLGFELAAVFETYPQFGPIVINDQAAEEAFTFYDHPKVLIFKKTADFNADKLSAMLNTVDLTNVVHLTPKGADGYKSLMLSEEQYAAQRAGGTWSQLFNYDWLQNKYPIIGLLLWYAFIFLLGLFAYPIVRLALPGFRQYAYPLGRIAGLSLLAWISWMGGSLGVPYTRVSIGAAMLVIAVAGVGLWWMRKEQFKNEWDSNRKFFTLVEIIFAVFFLIDLLIRFGNSDLWHPSKGGERPMDFSYFNAILKGTSFPPYDPWFAGGYINYYYYGFVLAGTPVKLLGIVPSIAYNFILPTWFALVAVGAFAIGWNLLDDGRQTEDHDQPSAVNGRLAAGLSAAVLSVLLGNLGTIQMIFQALQRMAAPGGIITDATFVQRWIWAFQGFMMSFGAAALPIGRGEWYWNPSRVIPPGPGNEITEFPLFTFLYSDLHAHMLVIPLALFVIAWALSFVKSRAKLKREEWVVSFLLGAMVLGAVYPTNLSDFYTYLLLAIAAIGFVILFRADVTMMHWLGDLPDTARRLGLMVLSIVAFTGLSFAFYQPYRGAYSQSYGTLDPWTASYTPVSSYLTHWGLFLFIIFAWIAWETREWMANTPLTSLSKLRPFAILIELALAGIFVVLVYFAYKGIWIGWLALPLAAWAGILLLRPNLADEKRLVLFLIGTALAITIVVELRTVRGDIGRMNTVFKFYMQSWILFSVSAAAALGWMLNDISRWSAKWRNTMQVVLSILIFGATLFTFTATSDKITDRAAIETPRSLDGLNYMQYASYFDHGQNLNLSEDYRAIRWMQDHVQGSPVIVEAAPAGRQYEWHSRFTIYTGLPGVVGWQWHQQQQRVLFSNQIIQRGIEVDAFYATLDQNEARKFLERYDARYIIVGQLEQAKYAPLDPGVPNGLIKFDMWNGVLWNEVYRDGSTVIYEVIQ